MSLLLVALAAACGAAARYTLDFFIVGRTKGAFPWGTFAVNISGSLALGFLVGLVLFQELPVSYRVVLGTGFLGAYTTFSTWMYESVRLLQGGEWGTALWNLLGSLGVGAFAAAFGLWLATMVG